MAEHESEALAHVRIQNLLARYFQAVGVEDHDILRTDVIAEDAIWEVRLQSPQGTMQDRVEGREAILAWLRRSHDVRTGPLRPFVGTHVIEIDGDTARSVSHLMVHDITTLEHLANGVIHAEHVRTPDGWRMHRYLLEETMSGPRMGERQEIMGNG